MRIDINNLPNIISSEEEAVSITKAYWRRVLGVGDLFEEVIMEFKPKSWVFPTPLCEYYKQECKKCSWLRREGIDCSLTYIKLLDNQEDFKKAMWIAKRAIKRLGRWSKQMRKEKLSKTN